MSIISLLTDRKSTDFFLGKVRGQLARLSPKAQVIDLAHDIGYFNVIYAGFILKHSHANFPDKTIHLVGVDCEKGENQKHLLVCANNQYFICADNGIPSFAFKEHEISGVYDISNTLKSQRQPALLEFIELASMLLKHFEPEQMGERFTNYKRFIPYQPTFESEYIIGKVVYIDSYRNVITNIDKDLFDYVRENRKFSIYVGSISNRIQKINNSYQESFDGDLLAVFNSMNLLEIAIHKGQAADLMNLTKETTIRIEFEHDDYTYRKNDFPSRVF